MFSFSYLIYSREVLYHHCYYVLNIIACTEMLAISFGKLMQLGKAILDYV